MNDKLLKMALDAHLINYIDHETPRVYFICGHADIEDVEKFAELIIKECSKVLTQHGTYFSGDGEPYQYAARLIEEHFGVDNE